MVDLMSGIGMVSTEFRTLSGLLFGGFLIEYSGDLNCGLFCPVFKLFG